MKKLIFLLISALLPLMSMSQSVPMPDLYALNQNNLEPYGYTQVGTNWDTSPFLPFAYQRRWLRLMPPNGVTYNSTSKTWSFAQPGQKYPLILFFHGAGERGTDNNNQLRHGGQRHRDAVQSGLFPGFLVYPQSVTIEQAKQLIDKLIQDLPVDPNRIYVHGLSGGGGDTWKFAITYPQLVAAAFPMSASDDAAKTQSMLYMPLRQAQGGMDNNPHPGWTQTIVDWFNTNGGHLEYFYLPTVGHGTWESMYSRSDFFPWFLSQRKNKILVRYNRNEICPEAVVNVDMGFTPGFDAYEWRKDGVLINGQTAHKIIATTYGTYTGRFRRGGVWSDWSEPVVVGVKATTNTPPIQANGLTSILLPAPDGKTTTELMLPEGYQSYAWRNSSGQTVSTSRIFTNVPVGTYTATANEFNGCATNPSPVFTVLNANGPNSPDAIASFLGYALTESSIALSWTDKPSPTYNETGFEVYRSLSSGAGYSLVALLPANTITYTDNNLTPNTTYYYKIRPVNQFSAGPVSETISILTQVDNIPPSAPTNLTITSTTPNAISLQWGASSDNVGVFKYDVYRDDVKILATDLTSATLYNLTEGQTYRFFVKARDLTGNISTESNLIIGKAQPSAFSYKYYELSSTPSVLPNFNNLTPVLTGYSNSLDISVRRRDTNFAMMWQGVIYIPVAGNYTFMTNSDDGSKLYIGSYSENNLVVNNDGAHGTQDREGTRNFSQPGVYNIIVTYFQGGGGFTMNPIYWKNTAHGVGNTKTQIPLSQFFAPSSPAGSPPLPPTNLVATATSFNAINLTWSDVSNNETGFRIYRATANAGPFVPVATVGSNTTSYLDQSLSPSTRYYYQIRAYGQYGESGLSNQVPRGLSYSYYEAPSIANINALLNLTPVKTGQSNFFDVNLRDRNQNFGLIWKGKINITTAATYTFYTSSDDGSTLLINNVQVVSNDFNQNQTERSGTRALTVGWHDIEVRWRKNTSTNSRLTVSYARSGMSKTAITASNAPTLLFGTEVNAITQALPAAPATPTNFVVSNLTPTSLSLTWQDNATNETSYRIMRSFQQNNNYVVYRTLPANSTSFVDEGLFANATYYYKVVVIGAGGSNTSVERSGTTSNNLPQITPIQSLGVKFGATKSINIYADDADNDPLVLTVTGLPAFATFADYGDGTGLIQVSPLAVHLGEYPITVQVRDSYNGMSSTSFVLTVTDKDIPVILPINNVSLNEGQSSNLLVAATSDFGVENITWSIQGLPEFISYSTNNGTCSFSITPGYIHSGVYPITVSVSDPLLSVVSRTFTVTVADVDPNNRVMVNLVYSTNASLPWNNMNTRIATGLRNEKGTITPIGVEFLTTAWNTYIDGATTSNNTGVFPDNVIRDYYYFGIFGAPETVSVRVSGLIPSKRYNFAFLGSSRWTGVADNGSTVYSINGTAVSLRVQNNSQNLARINSVIPNTDGTVTFTMSKANGTSAGFLNAFTIEELYEDGVAPAAPRELVAQVNGASVQLSWVDAPFNETGFNVYRSTSPSGNFLRINTTTLPKNSTTYQDNQVQEGLTYYYKVVAVNSFGQSPDSNSATVTLPNLPPQIIMEGSLTMAPNEFGMLTVYTAEDATLTITGLPVFAYPSPAAHNLIDIILLPEATHAGTYPFIVSATDTEGLTTQRNYALVVEESVLYRIMINMSQVSNAAAPWNNTAKAPALNDTFTNLRNQNNVGTGVNLTLLSAFQGVWNEGATTGNNSGVVPDNVLREYYYFGYQGGIPEITMRLSGLSPANRYRIKFVASSNFTGGGNNGSTVFTIGTKSASVNVQGNTSQLAVIEDVVPTNTGLVTIRLSKGPNAPAGYINAMIIEALPVDPSQFNPTNLTAAGLSKTQIVLNWSDNSPVETGYEIYRSTTGAENSYTLIGTTGADVSTYTDAVSQSNQLYHYRVRATSASGPSDYTNVAKSSAVAFRILVNVAAVATYDAPIPWNNLSRFGFTGDIFHGFRDDTGLPTGLRLRVQRELEAGNNWGTNTGNNSGIFPDNVLISFWYNNSFQPQGEFVIDGLDQSFSYNLGFMGAINVVNQVRTDFTVGGVTVTNTNHLNTTNVSYIRNIRPDTNSEILFTVRETAGSPWSIFNALVIEGYASGNNANGRFANNLVNGNLKEVRFGEATDNLSLYPNPVTSNTLNLKIDDSSLGELQYQVLDLTGKEVLRGTGNNDKIQAELSIDLDLPPAMYMIKVVYPNGKFETRKFIKN
ncbi:MAG: fibronectin type III domain-containing protein [Cyclobacteriaceae bacterium]|nr:fibronectin type III domain-containing protein [Cyclobacteriaceae bacterium]